MTFMGEFSFIEWIRKRQKRRKDVMLGIGDDCAVINVASDKLTLITTDMLVDGTHFDLKKCTVRDAGRKAIACNISDIAAMGCQPTIAVISICFPQHTTEKFARELYKGIWDVADKYNIEIVGGDIISGSSPFCISVTMLGRDDGLKPIRRSGAKAGDKILVTGALGGSILGKHLSFEPRLKEALALNKNFTIHAMIDISDGLTADLNHILEESGVGAILYEDHIPVSHAAVELSRKTGHTPLYHALSDGEDYELLMTLSKAQAKRVLSSGLLADVKVSCIGEIVKGRGIQMKSSSGNIRRIKPRGYEHLKS
ncbi:MAG: thiamine-phosphate kinase [Candidatus Brocadia sp. AMX2]|nr:MAG: thiamine-phosphate kinase [Candidatus Brocadia sp. AMX2]MBC6934133.1 thiamine-phosphate kinase [Candidatus Brocadia sp.]MBL1170763.1 thiamine-phosphate kinase [Candidatus Brocadia sp. AMX1]GIK14899.1 MAG: thiamine-monophosphate kinase [Candidatus Brocadia sinica]MCE7868673.1 thiamine-phosphate kinase [Candidatus Brocadia sp. AMX2]